MGIEGGTFEDKRQLFLQRVFDSCNTSFAVGAVVESLSLADNKSHIVTAAPEDSQEVLIKKHEGREKLFSMGEEVCNNSGVVSLAVELADLSDPMGRHFLRAVVSRYLHFQTIKDREALNQQHADDNKSGKWLSSYLGNHPKSQFSKDELLKYFNTFAGSSYYDRFLDLGNKLKHGIISGKNLPRAQFLYEALQSMEQNDQTEIFLKTVKTLMELGEKTENFVEKYLSLMHGMPDETTDRIDDKMEAVIQKLREDFVTWEENSKYFYLIPKIQRDTIINSDYDPNAYFMNIFHQFGITDEEWNAGGILNIADPDHISPAVATANYFFIPEGLDYSALESIYPDLGKHPFWESIQNARVVLIARGSSLNKEMARAQIHESGHALQFLLSDTESGKNPYRTLILGEAATQSEIFSSMMEWSHPDPDFIKPWKRFLTIRFAALTQFELRLWLKAKKLLTKNGMDVSASVGDMMIFHDRVYQETLGKALGCETPKRLFDGAGGDFSRPFYFTAGYVYGDIIARVIHEKLKGFTAPSDKRAFLEKVAGAVFHDDSLENILDALGISSWDEAVKLYVMESG